MGPVSDGPIRVVLVDDDPLVRAGLGLMLRGAPQLEIVGEAGDGAEGLDVIARTCPDVVLMDIRMPRMDGLTATQRLSEQRQPPKVIVLTTFDADEHVLRALGDGATGFLLKDAPAAELAVAIRRATAGERVVGAGLALAALSEGNNPLSTREREVLGVSVDGASIADLAARLSLSEGTVRNHLSSAIQKLGAHNRTEAARIAEQKGWL